MFFQNITKSIFNVTNVTGQALSGNAAQSLEGALQALATEMRAPQFSAPLSFSGDLPIRGTPLQGEAGGLFGALRSGGSVHLGLDLAATIGTAVTAAENGLVVFAGLAKGYGNVVYVNHADGYQTRYAHLSEVGVKEGDAVEKGSVIGLVGKTGNAASPDVEPHVHFEVRKILDQNAQDLDSLKAVTNKQSQALDPLPFILGHPAIQATMATPKQVLQKNKSPQPKEYPKEEGKPENKKTKAKEEETLEQKILRQVFTFLDQNKDAQVDEAELKNILQKNIQQNGGILTQNGLSKVLGSQAGVSVWYKNKAAAALIKALDTNNDRKLSEDEINQMVQNIMSVCDCNADQKVDEGEFAKLVE